MHEDRDKPSSFKVWVIILLILILGVGVFILFQLLNDDGIIGSSAHIDENATEWDDEIDTEGDIEGRILVPGYSGAKIKAGETTLALRIGNPAENTCYLQATLQLEDGTVLYESGLIEPGKGYDTIELNQSLEEGEYNAVVHYQGYSMDEGQEKLNSCDSAFVLKVTGE